ncbi:hypothetical protein JCM3770_003017, partial [Rhodotorula araucariae]
VLPAAQPSFLQEIAVLDHRPSAAGSANGDGAAAAKKAKKHKRSQSSGSDDGSAGSSGDEQRRGRRELPRDALVVLGQTSKKFLVVPEITDLLDKVALQEKAERDEERRVKLEKARGPVGGAERVVPTGRKKQWR